MESQASVSSIGQISNVVSLNGQQAIAVNGASLAGLTAVPATLTVPVSSMQGLQGITWYNYVPAEGVPQLLTTATGQTVQVELAGSTDLTRQFNQQVQTQYGPIQVALLPASAAPVTTLGGQGQQTQIQQQVIPIHIQQQPIHQHVQQQQQPQQQHQLTQQLQGQSVKMEEAVYIGAIAGGTSISNSTVVTEMTVKKNRVKASVSDRVQCPSCPKTVSCLATLKDHMRTHTGERPFPCSECGLAFSQRSNLRMHKRLHTGERPYMCGICGKTFARSSHLPAHMRTHTGEKPYVCKVCNHAFITAQQLKNHHRVHTGEKPWKCDQCDAAFTHSSSLSTHKKKHTGYKKFQCDKCDKKFFFTSALDKHMKVHTKNRPFKCATCENTFKYKESLTVHMERYCGRQTEKKQRAPRKPDAKKPGPKPGTGRKYVQQRKGRPRGRPRKKGRWAKRGRKFKSDSKDAENSSMNEEPNEVLGLKDEVFQEKIQDIIFRSERSDDDENVPVAELKVENIEGTNETRVLMESIARGDSNGSESGTLVSSSDISHSHALSGSMVSAAAAEDIVTPEMAANIVQLDDSGLTIVSAEEAERHIAAGGLQLLTLQPEMLQLMQGSTHSQIISAEQLQQLQQQQNQLNNQHHIQVQQHPQLQQQQQQIQIVDSQHQLTVQQQQHHQTQHQHVQTHQQLQQQVQHHQQQQQQQIHQQSIHSLSNASQPTNSIEHEHIVKDGLRLYYTR